MAKFKAIYDTDPSVPQQAHMYMHCGKCLEEMPDGVSPKNWARQQLAVTKEGRFQLWCTRHNCNIALISIEPKEESDGA
jgi:hypothetical protein